MRVRTAIPALAFLGLLAGSSDAQPQVRHVPDAIACGRCAVTFRTVVTLQTGDSVLLTFPGDVSVSRNGTIYVAEFRELPQMFSSDGRFSGYLGVKGSGPGEFTGILGFSRTPGDSLLVHLDDERVVLVDASNVSRRQVAFPSGLHPLRVFEWPRRVLATGYVGSPEAAGYQLHVLDLSGSPARVVSSFGWERGQLRPNAGNELQQHLSAPRAGSVWVADPLEYRLGQWTAAGENSLQLKRSPTWFTGRSLAWIGNPTTPPPPSIVGIAEDGDGLLWVYTRVAGTNWKAGWPEVARGTREVSARTIDREKLFEIILEVIDPREGHVVLRQNVAELVLQVLENGDIVTYRSRADGSPAVTIQRPSLGRR